MKERKLREHATCSLCKQKIGHTGLPLFWIVRIERHRIDMGAVRRQTGLAMMLGNAAIAEVMGPDEDMTTPAMEPATLTVCETCAVSRSMEVAALGELAVAAR